MRKTRVNIYTNMAMFRKAKTVEKMTDVVSVRVHDNKQPVDCKFAQASKDPFQIAPAVWHEMKGDMYEQRDWPPTSRVCAVAHCFATGGAGLCSQDDRHTIFAGRYMDFRRISTYDGNN